MLAKNWNSKVEKITESKEFSLLLLTIQSADKSETRLFIVGMKNEKATNLLKILEPTVLDFGTSKDLRVLHSRIFTRM